MSTASKSPRPSEEFQTKPWKYLGYPVFSQWLASDHDFFLVRRFDSLNARVILMLQWEIVLLEDKLAQMDRQRSALTFDDVHNGSFEDDDPARLALIREIYTKLKRYNDFIAQHSALKERPLSKMRDIQNLENWHNTYPGAIHPFESAFVKQRDDLINLVKIPRTPLRSFLERFDCFRWSRVFQHTPHKFKQPSSSDSTGYDPEITRHHAEDRIDGFVNAVICLCGFLMLIIPLWILLYTSSRAAQLGIITAFVALFLAIVQSVSVARPFESLAATAAYAAVLMVFMQIGSQDQ